jgi:hypothetical protein
MNTLGLVDLKGVEPAFSPPSTMPITVWASEAYGTQYMDTDIAGQRLAYESKAFSFLTNTWLKMTGRADGATRLNFSTRVRYNNIITNPPALAITVFYRGPLGDKQQHPFSDFNLAGSLDALPDYTASTLSATIGEIAFSTTGQPPLAGMPPPPVIGGLNWPMILLGSGILVGLGFVFFPKQVGRRLFNFR